MGKVFHFWCGANTDVEFEAMLSYWLSWYILLRSPEDSLSSYGFPIAIKLDKGERLALVPIYLGFLFYWLDECVDNIVRSNR